MKLYIQIENGQPVNHPALDSNLIQAFGAIPANWEPFERLTQPALGVYEKNQTVSYQKIGEFWTDVFSCEQMTSEEIAQKQQAIKDLWVANNGFASWSFDEVICAFLPPVSYPTDGNNYAWRESDTSWVYVPEKPHGEGWSFNLISGVWEQV
jgi:hypothetical protein